MIFLIRGFFNFKNILNKLSCYHDNYFKYFMFGEYNTFASKAKGFCMQYFLFIVNSKTQGFNIIIITSNTFPLITIAVTEAYQK